MATTEYPLSIFAHRLAESQARGWDVVVTLRTRPARTVRGVVTYRRRDPGKKIDPKQRNRSNLLVTVAGEELAVERMSDVRLIRS